MAGREESGRKVPKFRNEQEAAAFWNTHSPNEFPEEFNEVKASFARPLIKRGLTIKLSEVTIQELKEIADQRALVPRPSPGCGSWST